MRRPVIVWVEDSKATHVSAVPVKLDRGVTRNEYVENYMLVPVPTDDDLTQHILLAAHAAEGVADQIRADLIHNHFLTEREAAQDEDLVTWRKCAARLREEFDLDGEGT